MVVRILMMILGAVSGLTLVWLAKVSADPLLIAKLLEEVQYGFIYL